MEVKSPKAIFMAWCSKFQSTAKLSFMSSHPGRPPGGHVPVSSNNAFWSAGRAAYSGVKMNLCSTDACYLSNREKKLQHGTGDTYKRTYSGVKGTLCLKK